MRSSSADQRHRCTPVHPFASTGRSAPLASMRCVDTTFPLSIVVTSAASPVSDGVMHTSGPFTGAGTNADSPAGDAVQQPTQPCHFGPMRDCCAPAALAAITRMVSGATHRFMATFIESVLMDEAYS